MVTIVALTATHTSCANSASLTPDTSSNSLRPAPIYRFLASLRPTSLRLSLLATVPVITLSLLLALVAPVASVMALNAVLVALHTSVYAYSAPLPGFWPFSPVSSPVLPQEEDKISSEKSLRERQVEDWVGTFEDTRQQVVDEWSLSFTTAATASRRRSASTQSSPMRVASRLYSPVKARLLRTQDSGIDDTFGHTTTGPSTSGVYDTAKSTDNTYTTAQSEASKTSKASKTSEHSVRFARPLSPTPKAARLGFDESDMSLPAPLRLPPLAKVAPSQGNSRKPSTPPRSQHDPVHSTENGTPTSWLSSPGQSSILHPDWSFSSSGSDPAAFLSSTVPRASIDTRRSIDVRRSINTSRLSVDGYRKSMSVDLPREPPYAFLSQDPTQKRKRGSTQTAASVSFHDYVSVHSAHSTSRQKLSDAPGTVRRLSCPASIAESFNMSVGGSILGDYSASPSQPLPRSFESLRSFRTRTQSKSSHEPDAEPETQERWEVVPPFVSEFVPAELFKERNSEDVPSFFVDIVEDKEVQTWSLGWPGVLGSLLLLGLSSPALLAEGVATRALLLASSFVPALVVTTSSILSPRPVEVDIEAEQKRIKYHPRDRSLRPTHGKLLRARPELSFAPPSPLKSRPRTMSAAARLRTLRGGIVSAMAPAMGHCASDSVGSTGTHDTQASTRSQAEEADGSHGWLDAHIGVATVATRSRSPSVLKLDWTGIASAPTTPARKTMTHVKSPRKSPAKGTPRKGKDSDDDEEEDDDDDVLAAATAVAPSPSRVQRRRTSAFATSGCDFSLPSSGYAPSLRGSITGAAAAAQRALPKRAPLNRVVTCPISKASAPPPRLPKSSGASGASGASNSTAASALSAASGVTSDAPHTASSSDTFGTKAASAATDSRVHFSTYDFSKPRQISSSEGEGIGRAVLGFNIPPPTTPMPPAPSVPAAPLALAPRNISAEKIDLYSTPARRAKSSETSSILRNAELARLLLAEGTPAPARHKRSFSGGSVRSHPYSVSRSARSSRSTKSSKGSKDHKSSASWASIKASLKSSVPSPLTPKFAPKRPSTPSTIARLESSFEERFEQDPPAPRSHPHPRPFSCDYATPWDHAPLRSRAPLARPVPDVGSSYEVSSRENTRLHTTSKRSKSEAAFVRHLDKAERAESAERAERAERAEKGLRPLVLAERHNVNVNEPVKRSPRFGGTPNVSGVSLSDETEDEISYFDVSSSLKPGIKAFVSRLSGTPDKNPGASTERDSGTASQRASASQRTSIFGLGNMWNSSSISAGNSVSVGPAMNSPNVRAGRGRDTSPVRRARSPVGPKPKPMPMRL